MSATGPSRWELLGESTQATTRIFDLRSSRYRHPIRGSEREFAVIRSPDWVNVLAITTDERLVLVRQFRFGVADFSLEIPGGVIDAGEDPVAAGLRELREETGYAGAKARLLGTVHPNPAIQSNRCHFVLAEDVTKAHELQWDADEEIDVTTEAVDNVFALARAGGITHSLVIDALFMFEPLWRGRGGQRT